MMYNAPNSPQQAFFDLVMGINTLNVPRLEDLPYWTSPPIQFVYESTAVLNAGTYVWTDNPSALLINRPILDNALYFFRNISLTADISELDFTLSSPAGTPIEFRTYLRGDSRAVLFREPILMNKFYTDFIYRLLWMSKQGENDTLLAGFRGTLNQTANLLGKENITLKAIISAQEIVDENYINLFKLNYPETRRANV